MIDEDWRTQFIDFIKEFKLPPHVDPKSAEAARIIRLTGQVSSGQQLFQTQKTLSDDALAANFSVKSLTSQHTT